MYENVVVVFHDKYQCERPSIGQVVYAYEGDVAKLFGKSGRLKWCIVDIQDFGEIQDIKFALQFDDLELCHTMDSFFKGTFQSNQFSVTLDVYYKQYGLLSEPNGPLDSDTRFELACILIHDMLWGREFNAGEVIYELVRLNIPITEQRLQTLTKIFSLPTYMEQTKDYVVVYSNKGDVMTDYVILAKNKKGEFNYAKRHDCPEFMKRFDLFAYFNQKR